MSHIRLQQKRNLYVGISTGALLIIWIVWIITAKPYSKQEPFIAPEVFSDIASTTSEIKSEYTQQKEQFDLLRAYLLGSIASTTTSTLPMSETATTTNATSTELN